MKVAQQNTFVKVSTLQMIEMVFAGIEQSQMQIVPTSHLTAEIQSKIESFRKNEVVQSIEENSSIGQTEAHLFEELELWHKSLIERDREFTALDLRSFCSNAMPRFEHDVYAALAGFYRNLSQDDLVLSKFDYVITQYFSSEGTHNRRVLRMGSEQIVDELRRLNIGWDDGKPVTTPHKSQIRESIFALSKLSAQAKTHKTLRSWLENEFFNYSREVKRELGETFFVPEVTTAVVLCNLTLGNHFAALCEADSEMLNNAAETIAADKDSEGVISSQLNSSFQTLIHSGLEEDFAETMAHERLSNLFSLISGEEIKKEVLAVQLPLSKDVDVETSVDNAETRNEKIESLDLEEALEPSLLSNVEPNLIQESNSKDLQYALDDLDSVDESLMTAEHPTEIDNSDVQILGDKNPAKSLIAAENVLNELNHSNPDQTVIKNYLEKSAIPEIRELQLKLFLGVEGKTDEKSLRSVLRLIVSIEETMRFAKNGDNILSGQFQSELDLLNEEIQAVNNGLRQTLNEAAALPKSNEAPTDYFEASLYALNTLVQLQIRLNSATAPRQTPDGKEKLAEIPANKQTNKIFEKIKINSVGYKEVKTNFDVKTQLNKWLLIAAATVILLGGGWFLFSSINAETPITNSNVQALDPKVLRGGNDLLSAKINKNTLFGFVGKEWSSQTPEQKKDNLKLLLDEGSKYGFSRVLLISKNGEMVGNASETEIKIF